MKINDKLSIGLILFILIGAFFTSHVPFDSRLSLVSSASMFLFAFPSFYYIAKTAGFKKGVLAIIVLSIFALSIETIAIKTGFPYGEFIYMDKLGYKLFGITPWTVPLAWVPLVLGSMTIAQRFSKHLFGQVVISTFLLVVIDLVLDPGAVAMDFWKYTQPSVYYGVPLSNFLGWIFSGFIGSILLYIFLRTITLPWKTVFSYFLILLFWTNIAMWKGLWIPFSIGFISLFLLSYYSFCKKIW